MYNIAHRRALPASDSLRSAAAELPQSDKQTPRISVRFGTVLDTYHTTITEADNKTHNYDYFTIQLHDTDDRIQGVPAENRTGRPVSELIGQEHSPCRYPADDPAASARIALQQIPFRQLTPEAWNEYVKYSKKKYNASFLIITVMLYAVTVLPFTIFLTSGRYAPGIEWAATVPTLIFIAITLFLQHIHYKNKRRTAAGHSAFLFWAASCRNASALRYFSTRA